MVSIVMLCPESPDLIIDNMMRAANEDGIEINILPMSSETNVFNKFNANIILLSPQARYKKNDISNSVSKAIPVVIIDTVDYGMMDGRAVFEVVKKKLGIHK